MTQQKLSFEQQLQGIFSTIFMGPVALNPQVVASIRQHLKLFIQQLLAEAVKRGIRRGATLTSVDLQDILYAIQKRGQKYKLKVGKSLIINMGDGLDRKMQLNPNDELADILDDD